MNILVTGGAGFIGSHVVDAYILAGHSVYIIDDLTTGQRENINPKAHFFQVDIRSGEIESIFKMYSVDVINHHAAQMDVRKSVVDPQYDASVNIAGMLNLMENAMRYGVKKVIFASTGGAIYGEQDYFPADEDHPMRPLSPYGIAKLATENYLYYYKKVHGISSVILRYANVYGPRQNPHGEAGVVAIFSDALLRGEQPVINGDGLQTRDYVFVGDVVRANVLALTYRDSEIFNIGTGIETDVNTIYASIQAALGSHKPEVHGQAKKGEQLRSVISSQKIGRLLGWKPSVTIKDGLLATVKFFRSRMSAER
jgi:UDP-glucose 4-epimerase